MLSFTTRGAVRSPATLQIRVGALESGALRAGAPTPSRDMTPGEVRANVEHFTVKRDTPRSRPCERLALSAVRPGALDAGLLRGVRELGIREIVLHGREPGIERFVDVVAVRWPFPSGARPVARFIAVVGLTAEVVDGSDWVQDVIDCAPDRVVLAWPFPGARVHRVDLTVAAAHRVQERFEAAGIPSMLRGLPPCLDGSDDGRTRNRFYVDADHQCGRALLFSPDIVNYLKPDSCRVCAKAPVCDGVPAGWLGSPHFTVLEPIPR